MGGTPAYGHVNYLYRDRNSYISMEFFFFHTKYIPYSFYKSSPITGLSAAYSAYIIYVFWYFCFKWIDPMISSNRNVNCGVLLKHDRAWKISPFTCMFVYLIIRSQQYACTSPFVDKCVYSYVSLVRWQCLVFTNENHQSKYRRFTSAEMFNFLSKM